MLYLQFMALMHLYKKEKHDVIIVEADANSLWGPALLHDSSRPSPQADRLAITHGHRVSGTSGLVALTL